VNRFDPFASASPETIVRKLTPLLDNELTPEHFGRHIEDKCRALSSETVPNYFAILVIHLKRSDRGSALASLDLDRAARTEIRHRISEALTPMDRFALVGFDDITVFLPYGNSETISKLAANKLLKVFDEPIQIEGKTVIMHPAIGCAIFPDHGTTADGLLSAADEICERARGLPARFEIFRNVGRVKHYHALVEELRVAIDKNELEVWLQPQLSCNDLEFRAAEALIRWPRPVGKEPVHAGLIAEMAEQNGLMSKLTDFVTRTALRHLHKLEKHNIFISVGVNLSASVLSDKGLPTVVKRHLNSAFIPAERLTLEVTESSLMHDFEGALQNMIELKRLGTRLSIDDFGTGYSSLSYLRRMPLDELKIDQVFVRNILKIESDQQITQSVIDLSHNFGLEAVAEGVETIEVMDMLTDRFHCDILQGYLFSKPITVDQIIAWWPNRTAAFAESSSARQLRGT
jgi:EAL domain-containing protein (putative c-di-GMP-specific phosphodiesterase class I)/GGDEF domain-containing protein